MKILLDFPCIVEKYASFFEPCFSEAGFKHFKKALSGFMVSENKTLEGMNRLFVQHRRDQSTFNRFFNRQPFRLEDLHSRRLAMLQSRAETRFKSADRSDGGVLIIDNTLLKHYGQCFDNIYNLRDYVGGGYSWAHDLVTLHYSDEQTDYPVDYQLWEPPDWEAVANYLRDQGMVIRSDKWEARKKEPKQWQNYIRSRYQLGRKKHPKVVDIYKTKMHIAEQLLRQFDQSYPDLNYPVVLDTGFTSAEFCKFITQDLKRDYVGSLRGDQKIIRANNQKITLKQFSQELIAQHWDSAQKPVFQKVGYTFRKKKTYFYAYVANHRINNFEAKQRLVIAFNKKELTGTPYFVITNRLNWYPSGILRQRRGRWPVETYHQEAKAEGLDKYQVRNLEAIQSYIAFVVVTYSILQCAIHDDDLLSSIRQRLLKETDCTLPFVRRLMQLEAFTVLVEFIFLNVQKGRSLDQIIEPFIPCFT